MKIPRLAAVGLRSVLLWSVWIPGGAVLAQRADRAVPVEQLIRLRSVEHRAVSTPQYDVTVRGMSTQRDGRRDWLMLSAEYTTAREWTDEVTLTFYVVLEGDERDLPEGAGPRNMFTGTVTYINLRKGDHVSTLFLDPDTFERYGKVLAMAVLMDLDGRPAGVLTRPETKVAWWEQQSPTGIPLRNRAESPWALIEIETHDTLKP